MPSATPTTAIEPKRRWYQYSLRTMFIVVTVICVLLGTVVKQIIIPAERQRAAVETITRLGGRFQYVTTPDDESWFRQTLRKWLPSDYFDAIEYVWLQGSEASDADLDVLEDLTQLEWLHLNNTSVTDAGLVHLKGLTQLNVLYLDNTSVTDAGLVHLKGLTQLNVLYLDNTQVTDAGVAKLKEALPNCKIAR